MEHAEHLRALARAVHSRRAAPRIALLCLATGWILAFAGLHLIDPSDGASAAELWIFLGECLVAAFIGSLAMQEWDAERIVLEKPARGAERIIEEATRAKIMSLFVATDRLARVAALLAILGAAFTAPFAHLEWSTEIASANAMIAAMLDGLITGNLILTIQAKRAMYRHFHGDREHG